MEMEEDKQLLEKKYEEVNIMIAQKLKDGKASEILPKELQELCPKKAEIRRKSPKLKDRRRIGPSMTSSRG